MGGHGGQGQNADGEKDSKAELPRRRVHRNAAKHLLHPTARGNTYLQLLLCACRNLTECNLAKGRKAYLRAEQHDKLHHRRAGLHADEACVGKGQSKALPQARRRIT